MAQLSAMGPPQSPKEIRRSGRRQGPSGSTSTSKSPDSDQPPKPKDGAQRPGLPSSSSSSRSKRLKQEELEDAEDDPRNNTAPSVTSTGSNHGASNGKGKRKGKDKDKHAIEEEQLEEDVEHAPEESEPAGGDEEAEGITRCVCGSSEDDPDAGEFMIQCEECKVWQHGPCMGFMTEDQVDEGDYYCELCRPEQHVDLLRRLSNKKGRHAQTSRISRSRSPSQLKQQSKRRNTMNSRDFDESLKEIMEATAAEAAGKDADTTKEDLNKEHAAENDPETHPNGKKKRKRIEDELPSKKRTRSASTASERPASTHPRDETPVSASAKPISQAPAPSKGNGRNKRGGKKVVASDAPAVGDGDEAAPAAPTSTTTAKRQGNANRKGGGGGGGAKRPPLNHSASHTGSGANQETTSRARNPAGVNQHTAANAEARAYRNTHAYAVSQQPLHTSWGLPDYLAHMAHILPTEVPQPLAIRTSFAEGAEVTMERGVKVKWPAKRMSVGDMNKRVRALVEWVGREQIIASDRDRRRKALEEVLRENPPSSANKPTADEDGDVVMSVDDPSSSRPQDAPQSTEATSVKAPPAKKPMDNAPSSGTMKTMEELMEELISFQERFGPGAKTRERERRQGVSSL